MIQVLEILERIMQVFLIPGFGDPKGSYAVLEVKTNELPFILEDGQTIARIKYEKLNKKTSCGIWIDYKL